MTRLFHRIEDKIYLDVRALLEEAKSLKLERSREFKRVQKSLKNIKTPFIPA